MTADRERRPANDSRAARASFSLFPLGAFSESGEFRQVLLSNFNAPTNQSPGVGYSALGSPWMLPVGSSHLFVVWWVYMPHNHKAKHAALKVICSSYDSGSMEGVGAPHIPSPNLILELSTARSRSKARGYLLNRSGSKTKIGLFYPNRICLTIVK